MKELSEGQRLWILQLAGAIMEVDDLYLGDETVEITDDHFSAAIEEQGRLIAEAEEKLENMRIAKIELKNLRGDY